MRTERAPLRAATLALCLAAGSTPALAVSFDCSKATRPAEETICESQELGLQDDNVARLYDNVRSRLREGDRLLEGLIATQREWLRSRNACGYNFACIQSAQYERTIELCGISKLLGLTCADNGEMPL
jgi:uncharacterized protein